MNHVISLVALGAALATVAYLVWALIDPRRF